MEGFSGWLAYAGNHHRLAAGGLRVQPGLTADTIVRLARTMECKERLLGLAVDGAKAGIDYDPRHPGKRRALRRFLEFLRPHLLGRLSLGPDMGTTWEEIEAVAREVGIASVKGCVARAQGLEDAEFRRRLRQLDEAVRGFTLADRRAGHALAHCAIGGAAEAGLELPGITVGVQGFGTLGRAAALSLHEAGLTVTAVADEHGCVLRRHGLDVDHLLALPRLEPVTAGARRGVTSGRPELLLDQPLDVLVLAASEETLSSDQADRLDAGVVVVGANLGISETVEALLCERGIVVVPDFLGGCGGSASMDALFGPASCPSPGQVLHHVGERMRGLVRTVLRCASERGIPPRHAALMLCADVPPGRPYGRWACPPEAGR